MNGLLYLLITVVVADVHLLNCMERETSKLQQNDKEKTLTIINTLAQDAYSKIDLDKLVEICEKNCKKPESLKQLRRVAGNDRQFAFKLVVDYMRNNVKNNEMSDITILLTSFLEIASLLNTCNADQAYERIFTTKAPEKSTSTALVVYNGGKNQKKTDIAEKVDRCMEQEKKHIVFVIQQGMLPMRFYSKISLQAGQEIAELLKKHVAFQSAQNNEQAIVVRSNNSYDTLKMLKIIIAAFVLCSVHEIIYGYGKRFA